MSSQPKGLKRRATFSRGRIVLAVVLVVFALFAMDATRPPQTQRTAKAAIHAIHVYQRTIVPALGRLGSRCRFTPTCSHYTEAVLRAHGIVGGTWRAAWRIARCGPWTRAGTVDVPKQADSRR